MELEHSVVRPKPHVLLQLSRSDFGSISNVSISWEVADTVTVDTSTTSSLLPSTTERRKEASAAFKWNWWGRGYDVWSSRDETSWRQQHKYKSTGANSWARDTRRGSKMRLQYINFHHPTWRMNFYRRLTFLKREDACHNLWTRSFLKEPEHVNTTWFISLMDQFV